MVLRGILARRLVSSTLVVLTMLVVGGTVVVVGFARLTDTSRGSAGALVLLGFVAIAAQAAESMRRREPELALARLRGRRGWRLGVFVVAEPCVVVAAGALLGLGVGLEVGGAAADAWLPGGATFGIDGTVLLAAGAVTLACLGLVSVTGWAIVRAPLLQQIAGSRRPRASSTVRLFLQVVLVLGAVVAGYQAHQAQRSRVDWVTLVSPAVVGLAAGQVVIWLVFAMLAVAVPRGGAAPLGWFITLRRLLRRADSLALVRTVVAAGVVAGVAASAFVVAQDWREGRARLQIGAPVSYQVRGGALRAYAAAAAADPEGRWLTAVASYTDSPDGGSRRVYVDATRWDAVAGDFFAGTSAEQLSGALRRLHRGPPVTVTRGTLVTATVAAGALGPGERLQLTFVYVDDAGDLRLSHLALEPGGASRLSGGMAVYEAALRRCGAACSVSEVDLDGTAKHPVLLDDVTFAGERLLVPSSGVVLNPSPSAVAARRVGSGVLVRLTKGGGSGRSVLAAFRTGAPDSVVSTTGNRLQNDNGVPVVAGIDGIPRPVTVVARVDALPFVGTSGSAFDLSSSLAGSGGTVVGTVAAVLARADTPPSVLAALRATHAVGPPTTYDALLARLDESPRAQGTRLYALIAVFAGLIALVSIASTVAQQRRERRVEAASLRSVGVGSTTILAAYRREVLVVAGAALAGTAAAAWLSCSLLLAALPLVSGWAFAPALDVTPDMGLIVRTALVAGAAVAVITYAALHGIGRSAPPRLLREDPS